jgi:hypothetical protein
MKTKTLVLGVLVAALSMFAVSRVHAQDNPLPAVKIIPTDLSDVVKVIYGYDTDMPVTVKFMGNEGVFFQDKIKGEDVQKGFSRKYKLPTSKNSDLWVEVSSDELSVIYKMAVSKEGKWIAQLEKTTYNYPVVALN